MITEIDYGDVSQLCPVCNVTAVVNSRQRQKFNEIYVDKYSFICPDCQQLWFVTAVLNVPAVTMRKFLPVDDLFDNWDLFPDEQWQTEFLHRRSDQAFHYFTTWKRS